jgi:hypothetical protein
VTVVRPAAVRETGWDALATDGRIVRVRPVRSDDVAALTDLHARLSDRSRYLRSLQRQGETCRTRNAGRRRAG